MEPTTAESKRAVAASPIKHVLLDADGVLQEMPGGWQTALEPFVGDRASELLERIWADENRMLTGQGDFMAALAVTLDEFGVLATCADFIAAWHNFTAAAESVAVVEALRRNGYGVHLGTNQVRSRGEYMRTELAYDTLFDVSCYSYDLGIAKPNTAFFIEAARRIGAPPHAVLFIDDKAPNVEGAREAGMAAELWHLSQGHDVLRAVFAQHGVAAHPTVTQQAV